MTQHTQSTQGKLDPAWVAAVTGGRPGPEAAPARDLRWDTRELAAGEAFVALPGARTHGNAFLAEAAAKGAAFLLTDQAHPRAVRVPDAYRALVRLGRALRDRFPNPVIGVTGSVGKTSTKEAIAQGLGFSAPEGNLNTPPALARFFLHLGRPQGAVVELGIDRPGEMDDLLALADPTLGVLTAVAPAHLEGLGSLEAVAREKTKLLRHAPLKLAEHELAERLGLAAETYGFSPGARFSGRDLVLLPEASEFRYQNLRVRLPYPGRGVALAALAALAVAELLGRPPAEVAERLAGLKLPPGRMEVQRRGPYRVLFDAYNANPASLAAGLEVLARQPGRKVAVIGEMKELGEKAPLYHQRAALEAARVADLVVFVGGYAELMAEVAGGLAAQSTEEASTLLKAHLRPGDSVYLKASRALGFEKLLEVFDAG